VNFAWLLLADGMAQRPDGKLDIYGAGVDVIYAAATPAIHARLSVVGRLILSADEANRDHEFQVSLRGPDSALLGHAAVRFPPISEDKRELAALDSLSMGVALDFINLGLPTFGRYTVELSLDEEPVPVALSFNVVPTPAPAPVQAGSSEA
jgi:hypothetical protein